MLPSRSLYMTFPVPSPYIIGREIGKVIYSQGFIMRRPKKFITLRCKCKRKIQIRKISWLRDYQGEGKSHAHCSVCHIEWHLTIDGYIYSHPIKKISRGVEKNDLPC